MSLKTINIIGCGTVGQTLARLWHDGGVFAIGGIVNRSAESTRKAVDFIGGGTAFVTIADLPPADITMIATNDDAIEEAVQALSDHHDLDGHIVFHCSGAAPSSVLQAAKDKGAMIASVHPVKSFVDPADSVKTFAGTYCGVEGDVDALAVLEESLRQCGAKSFTIDAEHKILYHTANVFICNYLTALIEAGFSCYEQAGVPRDIATEVTKPIIAETIRNIQDKGTVCALTGPSARGDMQVVKRQLQALNNWNGDYVALYRQLGAIAQKLAEQKEELKKAA